MCLKVKDSFSEDNKAIAHFELPLSILEEIGCLNHCPCLFCAQVPEVARNQSSHLMSKYYVCDDG
ncbi:hypothetical protein G2W53_016606 [Senna tora]|uniref:Uncharacterized protein n=1 Tax=Senna tora TaxID=362788 RepID=A0A834WJM9_9FABA|nr:hypothetical protein G2W53_016606 [Senna tora]